MKFVRHEANEAVFNYMDEGFLFYIILEGKVSIRIPLQSTLGGDSEEKTNPASDPHTFMDFVIDRF